MLRRLAVAFADTVRPWFPTGDKTLRRGNKPKTLPPDDIAWCCKAVPERIVAIGDVHGDVEALACILRKADLINKSGQWIGNKAHLVLNGDLVGGEDSRLLVEFVMRLELEAQEQQGAVHSLLGNHDIMALRGGSRSTGGTRLFRQFPVPGAETGSIQDAFCGETEWADWLRRRNAIVKLGRSIFVHAGLNVWALKHKPPRVNATIRAWIRHWQGVGPLPDARTRWVVDDGEMDWPQPSSGPLWTRSFKVDQFRPSKRGTKVPPRAPEPSDVREVLRYYNADRVVVGHAPVDQKEIILEHPYYGPMVVMIDTRISSKKRGKPSYLEITGSDLRARYAKRTPWAEKFRKREQQLLKRRKSEYSGA